MKSNQLITLIVFSLLSSSGFAGKLSLTDSPSAHTRVSGSAISISSDYFSIMHTGKDGIELSVGGMIAKSDSTSAIFPWVVELGKKAHLQDDIYISVNMSERQWLTSGGDAIEGGGGTSSWEIKFYYEPTDTISFFAGTSLKSSGGFTEPQSGNSFGDNRVGISFYVF